jgi:predicted transcriptional regulator
LKEIFKSKLKKLITSIFYEVEENWTDPNSIKKLLLENGFKKYGDGKHLILWHQNKFK